jgi:hypothetical protein
MGTLDTMSASNYLVTTMGALEALYGERLPASIIKEIDRINTGYRALIEAAPFVAVTLTLSRAHLYPLTRGRSAARPAGAASWPPSPISF